MLRAMKRSFPTGIGNRSKKAKVTKQQKAAQAKLYADAIESVCSQQTYPSNTTSQDASDSSPNKQAISLGGVSMQLVDLLKLMQLQQQTIRALDQKVNILMSFLGLSRSPATEYTFPDTANNPADPSQNVTQNSTQQTQADVHLAPTQVHQPLPPLQPNAVQSRAATHLTGAIRQTVLSTVYVNQYIKERRANSVVIKGLDTLDDSSLKDAAAQLLSVSISVTQGLPIGLPVGALPVILRQPGRPQTSTNGRAHPAGPYAGIKQESS